MTFKKPFKAVPIRPKRLKGLDELGEPLWVPVVHSKPINWNLVVIGVLIGACIGLAYLLWFQ